MIKRIGYLLALVVVACSPSSSYAEVTYGDNVTGLLKFFELNNGSSGVFSVGDLAFDPTTPNQLYMANYTRTNINGIEYRGIYSVNLFGPEIDISDLDQHADIRILWEIQARNDTDNVGNFDTGAAGDADYPSGVLVDANGDLRVAHDRSESVWKVTNPLNEPDDMVDPEVETQMFGAYGNAAADDDDDDIISIAFAPAGFGDFPGATAFTPGSDIVVFDQGHDGDANFSIGVVYGDSTAEVPHYQEIFSETDLGANIDLRGDASSFDGQAYFARFNRDSAGRELFIDNIGNGDQPYIERVDGTGKHEYLFLDLPESATFESLHFDGALQVNQVDGSVWIVISNDGSREFYRIDAANATFVSESIFGDNFSASTTLEISFTDEEVDDGYFGNDSYSVGLNSMAFSPDGQLLVVGAPSSRDRLFVYNLGEEPVGLAGDFNGDMVVDAADYTVWRDNLGGLESTLNGNGDGIGTVDADDYLLWKNHFGETALGASFAGTSPVPEPSTIAMLAIGLVSLGISRRKQETNQCESPSC